jgi:hypothetical protein
MKLYLKRATGGMISLGMLAGAWSWLDNMPSTDEHGTWISPSYGQILRITPIMAEAYSLTSVSCVRERLFPAHLGLVEYLAGVTIEPNKIGINLHIDGALEPIPYVRADMPENCIAQSNGESGAIHTFDVFWAAMNDHYPFFDLHDVNWEDRRALAPATNDISDAELSDLLRRALTGLNDGHLLVSMDDQGTFTPSQLPQWLEQTPNLTRSMLWETALSGAGTPLERVEGISIRYGLRPDGIGYVALKEMEVQTAFGQTMHEATVRAFSEVADALSGANSIVVDVRYNPGGSDSVAMALASFFATEAQLAFSKSAWRNPSFSEAFDVTVAPSTEQVLSQPVVLLTGDLTGSAAEVFALTLREFPQVTTTGTNTAGALSDVLEFTLPNGWRLGLSAQKYVSVDGEVFEGSGIPADIRVLPDGAEISRGVDTILMQAIQLLSTRRDGQNGS